MPHSTWRDDEPIPFVLTDLGVAGSDPVLTSGPTRSSEDAARWLARYGRSLDEARAMVRSYQDEASRRLGVPVHEWGLDEVDVAAIDRGARVPAPRRPLDEAASEAELIDERVRWSGRDPQPADTYDSGWS